MTNFWVDSLNPKYYSAEEREAIKIHEEMRQLTERVIKLEKRK